MHWEAPFKKRREETSPTCFLSTKTRFHNIGQTCFRILLWIESFEHWRKSHQAKKNPLPMSNRTHTQRAAVAFARIFPPTHKKTTRGREKNPGKQNSSNCPWVTGGGGGGKGGSGNYFNYPPLLSLFLSSPMQARSRTVQDRERACVQVHADHRVIPTTCKWWNFNKSF